MQNVRHESGGGFLDLGKKVSSSEGQPPDRNGTRLKKVDPFDLGRKI